MEELKPCPFCGAEVKLYSTDKGDTDGSMYSIECEHCCLDMGSYDMSKKQLVKMWNTRTKE